jgi:L-alanine-DL-glutamate epimerase-like enolase superfamily enzyme
VPDQFTVAPFEFFVLRTRTRFPFRYGIASMTEVPHIFVRTRVTSGALSAAGVTAEGLPPKWFTKDPATSFEQDLPGMLEVIRHASAMAADVARVPVSYFDFWREVYRQQAAWAEARGIAPLLSNLGVSLVERAVLDGLCRLVGEPLHRLVAANRLGLRLGDVHPELGAAHPGELLPAVPLDRCWARHTVGLGDPLEAGDIAPEERVGDGLPQDLESSIRAYGLRYFKVKLSGARDADFDRLDRVAAVLERETAGEYFVTLDGNENFADFGAFRTFWDDARRRDRLRRFWPRVLLVEQPVHRKRALDESSCDALRSWPDRPPLIIDESDGSVGDLPRALDLGYAGTSHKNCKGIVKGLANACLLARRRREGHLGVLTGEDLCNLGPVALLQDLAVMAILGIDHVERNGHHYYRGLSMLPPEWQESTVAAHGDLYERHQQGFARLTIHQGRLQLDSVNAAPFGVGFVPDPERFETLDMTSRRPGAYDDSCPPLVLDP